MNFDEIAKELNDGTLSLTADEITTIIIASTTKDEVIDCDMISEIISKLQKVKKVAIDDYKAIKKETQSKQTAEKSLIGEKYFLTLPVGSTVSYKMADGTIVEGKVGSHKKGTKRAHIILEELPAGSTDYNRYRKFEDIIIPEDFVASIESVA